MILVNNNVFALHTKNTTYCFYVNDINHLEHLHYGKKITVDEETVEALKQKSNFVIGNAVSYREDKDNRCLETMLLEVSSRGSGDIRNCSIDILLSSGSRDLDFVYDSYEIRKHTEMKSLPTSHSNGENVEELVVHLLDKENNVAVNLIYSVYEECDVISRRMEIINNNPDDIKILKAMSMHLDLINKDYHFVSFHGGWAREMRRYDQPCVIGTINSESICGVSSSRSNPFVMLINKNTNEEYGEAYGFNLIYSGNHLESCETDTYEHIRLMSGINPTTFDYTLKNNEVFETPEAIMTYTDSGLNSLSHSMHDFVRKHVVRGAYQDLPRPVLNNSWEAAYFKFNERKIVKMAKYASKAGMELFVLDDGWFGTRNNDLEGLGDWYVNYKKLPGGLERLSKKINKLGMDFGIWVEPEMVNEKSNLFRNHPEWVIKTPHRVQSLGRHQYILDLSNQEVVDFLFDAMSDVFTRSSCKYVKWDMNRIFSEYFTPSLESERMNELAHRYYMGLYQLMGRLVKTFPHILFEGCSAGGNRFDLGILSYMPQIWASDNSDAMSRVYIQKGYSYGYPLSTLGCHVSDIPNHQTLRTPTVDTRYNVASMGLLGYECNLGEMSKQERKEIKKQVEEYKKTRKYYFDSDYYRFDVKEGVHVFSEVSKDQEHACVVLFYERAETGHKTDILPLRGLNKDYYYKVTSKSYDHDIRLFGGLVNQVSPIHIRNNSFLHRLISKIIKMKEKGENSIVKGDVLLSKGYEVNPSFNGTGWSDKTKLIKDGESRIYFFDRVN